MKLESELRDMFMAVAAAEDRSAAQVVRELMRGDIEQRGKARDYDDSLKRKIEVARQFAVGLIAVQIGAPHMRS